MTALHDLRQKSWAPYVPAVIVFLAVALFPILSLIHI